MSGHTPGPWVVNPIIAQVDAMPSLIPVCQLLWPTEQRSEAETKANANLVAAAPELLEALQRLVDSCDESDGAQYGTLGTSFVRSIANAAIAKATGEQP